MNRISITRLAILEDNYRVYSHYNDTKRFITDFDEVLEYDSANIFKGYISSVSNVNQLTEIIRKVIYKNKVTWILYIVEHDVCGDINLPMYLLNFATSTNMSVALNILVKINPNSICRDKLFCKTLGN
jgi:hypothetical protein